MSQRIEPALTPEEWAAARFDNRTTEGRGLLEMSHARLFQYTDDEGCVWDSVHVHGPVVNRPNTLALAALCLHGRISWEMVDALNVTAFRLEGQAYREAMASQLRAPQFEPGLQSGRDGPAYRAKMLRSVADLLESLLHPRTP